ncbi:2-amino-4-hydroxy-6-hydroxymethyldihydropteridine diphosphokinase [Candidatus Peregrinibacteria bacterium]|nr:2-amino-4-hydroxy-6-hydroxymethyldihydropteridine diphosphokinase [Candidatus Peregrinibacteria bacterium]
MATVFLALGSNIHPEVNLRKAATMLRQTFPKIQFSSVYRSKAAEVETQPDFLNAVAKIGTDLRPQEVKAVLDVIEHSLQKNPPYRFGPRTIDLDVLLYDDLILQTETLTIPHPRMHERRFVLEPLVELMDPVKPLPGGNTSFRELLRGASAEPIHKTNVIL